MDRKIDNSMMSLKLVKTDCTDTSLSAEKADFRADHSERERRSVCDDDEMDKIESMSFIDHDGKQ